MGCAGLFYGVSDAGLRSDLCTVWYVNVSYDADLPCDDAVVPDACRASDARLRGDDCVFADAYVMGDLYEVVYFGSIANRCGAHGCTVYGGVGSNLDVVAYGDPSHLRYFRVRAVVLWCKSESISSDDCPGVDDRVVSDFGVGV